MGHANRQRLRFNDMDVAANSANEVLRDAADEGVLHIGQAALAADDEIGIERLDELLGQRVGDAAGANLQIDRFDVGIVLSFLENVGKIGLKLLFAGFAQSIEVGTVRLERNGVDNVAEQQVSIIGSGDRGGAARDDFLSRSAVERREHAREQVNGRHGSPLSLEP